MSMTVAGTVNLVSLYPQGGVVSNPTHTTQPSSASFASVLSDGSDSTYLGQSANNAYYRLKVASTNLPAGARVVYARCITRAVRLGRSTADWVQFIGDSTGRGGAEADNLPTTHHGLGGVFANNSSPAKQTLANGKPIDQAAISAGLFACFGKNTAPQLSDSITFRVSEAYVELSYDVPPSASITSPSGSVFDSSSPLIQWDYTDDLQPQAAYQVNIVDSASAKVYDSGLINSSDTVHQVAAHLPAGDYTANLRVYQAWSGPGGMFPARELATSTFTIAALPLPTPTIQRTKTPLTLNYLTGDDTTFAASIGAWTTLTPSGAAEVSSAVQRDGANSITCPLDTHHLIYVRDLTDADLQSVPVKFTGYAQASLTDPAATVQIFASVNYYNTDNVYMGGSPNHFITLTNSDTWQPVVVSSTIYPPSGAAYFDVDFTLEAASGTGDFYLAQPCVTLDDGSDLPTVPLARTDEVSVTAYADSTVNLLTYDDSTFDNGPAGWQVVSNASIATTANPVLLGTQAGALTLTSTSGSVAIPSGAYVIPPNGFQITPGAFVYVRANATGKHARLDILAQTWNGVSWTNHTFSGPTVALTSGQWVKVPCVADQSNYDFGPFLTLNLTCAGASGDKFYVDNAYLGTDAGVDRDWSRGGVVQDRLNLLTYADSSMEPGNNWIAGGSFSTPASAVDNANTDHSLYGATSLKIKNGTGSAVSYSAQVGNGIFFPVDPAKHYNVVGSIFSPSGARSFHVGINFFDADFVATSPVNGTSQAVTSAVGKWTTLRFSFSSQIPADCAYLQLFVQVDNMAAGESQYIDGLAIVEYDDASPLGWRPGLPPDTDTAPTVLLEKADVDSPTFRPVGAQPLLDDDGLYQPIAVFPDYEIRSGRARTYRASLTETVNALYLQSPTSDPAVETVTLEQVWMHSRDDIAGTLAHFKFDGGGRTRQRGVNGTTTEVEGREFPFAEFSGQSTGQAQVTITLASDDDQAALEALAAARAEVVFRDQRGYGYSGTMGPVSYADTPYGSQASFTLQLSGDQP